MKTNNKFVLILLIIFSSSSIHSQLIRGCGIEAGPVLSYHNQISIAGSWSTPNKLSYTFGAYADFLGFKNFSVRVESNFIQKGAKFTDINISQNNIPEFETIITSINYISFSVNAKFNFNINSYLNPFVCIGPQFEILLNYDEKIMHGLYDGINKTSFGASLGFGDEISIFKKISLFSEFRYSFDLTSYLNGDYQIGKVYHSYPEGGKFSNRTLEFLIGVKFYL